MKLAMTIAAAAVAVAITSIPSATPAAAYCYPNGALTLFSLCPPPATNTHNGGGSSAGPYVIGCIGGSALGLIMAALVKGRTTNSELTIAEAQAIAFSCGLLAFPVIGSYTGPR